MSKQIFVGEYNKRFNEILGTNIEQKEIFRSSGLTSHLIKRNHGSCLKHIDDIPDIIKQPDYIGINPNEGGLSIELVKKYKNNVLIGIKVDATTDSLYISTMFDLQESKLQRRVHSGRLIKYDNIEEITTTEESIEERDKSDES